MKNMLGLIIGAMIVGGAIVVGVVMVLPLVKEYVGSNSLKNCAEIYHVDYTDTSTNSVVRTPIEEKVKECVASLR